MPTIRALLLAGALSLAPVLTAMAAGTADEDAGAAEPAADVSTGSYNEAPMLAAMVADGELPPVDERLPVEPAVVYFAAADEIGTYGGTLTVFHTSINPWADLGYETEIGGYVIRANPDTNALEPLLVRRAEMADDAMSVTFYLREGTRWSDGHPMTADDYVFMYEDAHWNDKVTTWNWIPQIKRAIKVDDYTVRFETDEPYHALLAKHASPPGGGWQVFHPFHYLKKWHINHNPDADALAKEEGFETWDEAFNHHFFWAPQQDLEQPTHHPWILTERTNTGKRYERNPYYWKVDPAGNQLPYVDHIQAQIVDGETYHIKIIAGEADFAVLGTRFDNFTLYKENEAAGDYRVVQIPAPVVGASVLIPNQFHENPFTREMYRDVRFRRALSLAMNRDEINELVFFGVGVPRSATIVSTNPWFKQEWEQAWAQHDPDAASALLDELGLTDRDADGFRTRPDGEAFLQILEHSNEADVPVLELYKEHFEAVGLKTEIRLRGDLWQRHNAGTDNIYTGTISSAEFREYTDAAKATEYDSGFYAVNWGLWIRATRDLESGAKTLDDFADGKIPGEEPPDIVKELDDAVIAWGSSAYGSPEYVEAFQKVFDIHAEQLFLIGSVGVTPTLGIYKNRVANYPTFYKPEATWPGDLLTSADKLFIKRP